MTAVDIARVLPSIAEVRALSQSLAVLDLLLSGDGHGPHTFDRAWRPGTALASMSNGGGDTHAIVFTADGALVLGFDHESEMSPYGDDDYKPWPGLVDDVPDVFVPLLAEPEFTHIGFPDPFLAATVCMWRRTCDPAWRTGAIEFPEAADPDGASFLFEPLVPGTSEAYRAYARHNWSADLGLADIEHIYEHRPLTLELVERLNPTIDPAFLAERLESIGYPAPLRSAKGQAGD